MFPPSINSSKFSTKVLHTKFDLPYFVKEMFNQLEGNLAGKVCGMCAVTYQRMKKIVGSVIEQIDVLA